MGRKSTEKDFARTIAEEQEDVRNRRAGVGCLTVIAFIVILSLILTLFVM